MITRRDAIAATSALAASIAAKPVLAATAPQSHEKIDFLFVQTAKGIAFDESGARLTLEGVSPITLFFSDRPVRIAGNMRTASFTPFWERSKHGFLSVPPNADVSLLEGDRLHQVVVVLKDPVLQGDSLTYSVKVLKGKMPAKAAEASVFIDVIGMPATPVSYAGVARRSYRRAVIY